VFQADPAFRFKPATRVEECLRHRLGRDPYGLNSIAAGESPHRPCRRRREDDRASGAESTTCLLRASYRKEEDQIEGGFAASSARSPRNISSATGDQSDALARIAAKNHKNASPTRWHRCAAISATILPQCLRQKTRWSPAR